MMDNTQNNMLPDTPPRSDGQGIRTPPTKRAKYILQRAFDATFNPSKVVGNDRILAHDSGDDSS